ncbi:hypothetical protein L596_018945 [Steinernema carpocapsae]|uniref:Uncharacterized protein n=1 Tax=Steinernema carpocapsae TaxID=34508 RepID=A0A4U5N7I8_STECR|nr:hypothetical protein L596_018945 [Steinernema carpocapsae]
MGKKKNAVGVTYGTAYQKQLTEHWSVARAVQLNREIPNHLIYRFDCDGAMPDEVREVLQELYGVNTFYESPVAVSKNLLEVLVATPKTARCLFCGPEEGETHEDLIDLFVHLKILHTEFICTYEMLHGELRWPVIAVRVSPDSALVTELSKAEVDEKIANLGGELQLLDFMENGGKKWMDMEKRPLAIHHNLGNCLCKPPSQVTDEDLFSDISWREPWYRTQMRKEYNLARTGKDTEYKVIWWNFYYEDSRKHGHYDFPNYQLFRRFIDTRGEDLRREGLYKQWLCHVTLYTKKTVFDPVHMSDLIRRFKGSEKYDATKDPVSLWLRTFKGNPNVGENPRGKRKVLSSRGFNKEMKKRKALFAPRKPAEMQEAQDVVITLNESEDRQDGVMQRIAVKGEPINE